MVQKLVDSAAGVFLLRLKSQIATKAALWVRLMNQTCCVGCVMTLPTDCACYVVQVSRLPRRPRHWWANRSWATVAGRRKTRYLYKVAPLPVSREQQFHVVFAYNGRNITQLPVYFRPFFRAVWNPIYNWCLGPLCIVQGLSGLRIKTLANGDLQQQKIKAPWFFVGPTHHRLSKETCGTPKLQKPKVHLTVQRWCFVQLLHLGCVGLVPKCTCSPNQKHPKFRANK